MILQAPVRASRAASRRECDVLRFDRRSEARDAAGPSARVMASFRDQHGQTGLTWMNLVDSSDHGLGVESPVPVPAGAIVFFHAPVAGRGDRLSFGQSYVRVAALAVRCPAEPDASGAFRVGLKIRRNRAA
ncbi:MAG: hypothetical protein AB7G11_00175 [Phycisphaerales bacterium]